MAALKRRHNKWEARVRVPKAVLELKGGGEFRYKTLECGDRRAAKAEADHWEAGLRAEWASLTGHDTPALGAIRAVYERTRAEASGVGEADDAALRGIDVQIDALVDEVREGDDLSPRPKRLA